MIKLLIEVLTQIASSQGNIDMERALMVIDYILCTVPIVPGEEVEVLRQVLAITKLLRKDWHQVFEEGVLLLAIEGKVPGGGVDRGVAVTHKGLCKKRASLYREKEPSIAAMGDSILSSITEGVVPP